MKNMYLIFLVIGVLLIGTFSFISLNEDKQEIEIEKNNCEPIIKKGDSIAEAVERYEKQDCFRGYDLFLEVKE